MTIWKPLRGGRHRDRSDTRGRRDAGASRASSVIGIAPLITTGLAVWLTDEKLTGMVLGGTLLILIGITLILSDRSFKKPDHNSDNDKQIGTTS